MTSNNPQIEETDIEALVGLAFISELHLQGQHDQKSHGNETKSVKAKKKEVKKTTAKPVTGIVKAGEQIYAGDQPVYQVHSDGDKMFKDNIFADEGIVLVGLKGEHKGVVLYTRPTTSHQDMLSAFDENSTDIDWAHFYIEFNEDTGKEQLFIDAHYVGYDTLGFDNIPMDEIYDNLHVAKKALIKVGVSPDRNVSVLEPVNEFKNRHHFDIALGELTMDDDALAEIGAGILVLDEIELHLGGASGHEDHPDGSPQSVHGGEGGSVVKEKKKYDPKLLSRASAVYEAMEDVDTALGKAADNQMRGGVLKSNGNFVEFTEKTKNSNTNKIIKELENMKEADPEAFELARQFSIADVFKVDDYEDLPDELTVYRGSSENEVLSRSTNVTSRRDIADNFGGSGSVKEYKVNKKDIVFSLSNSVFEEGELIVKSKNLSLVNEYLSDLAKKKKILSTWQKGKTIKMKDGRVGVLDFVGFSGSIAVRFGTGNDAVIDYSVSLDEVIINE